MTVQGGQPAAGRETLICLMGPTASGKTDLAIELAQQCGCELISVDSALVYRTLDIGSAKPDYPHHLVDICDPSEPYSAADFARDAQALVEDIHRRGKVPLLVGGTMLYFKAYLEGLDAMPPSDSAVRDAIADEAQREGWPALHRQLAAVDPSAAERIHPNHSQRLSRALEVFRISGIPLSQWHAEGGGAEGALQRYDVVQMALCPAQRSVLHQRIAQRFDQMMAQGFLDEVERLRARGDIDAQLPAARAVGYRQLWQHLDGECSLAEAVERGVAATRQLAKRQLTWLRKWPDLRWLYTDDQGNLSAQSLSQTGQLISPEPTLSLALRYLR